MLYYPVLKYNNQKYFLQNTRSVGHHAVSLNNLTDLHLFHSGDEAWYAACYVFTLDLDLNKQEVSENLTIITLKGTQDEY